jgi:hypothetical protein
MKSEFKAMLIIFFDIKGTVHKEFIVAGHSQFPILLRLFMVTV